MGMGMGMGRLRGMYIWCVPRGGGGGICIDGDFLSFMGIW